MPVLVYTCRSNESPESKLLVRWDLLVHPDVPFWVDEAHAAIVTALHPQVSRVDPRILSPEALERVEQTYAPAVRQAVEKERAELIAAAVGRHTARQAAAGDTATAPCEAEAVETSSAAPRRRAR